MKNSFLKKGITEVNHFIDPETGELFSSEVKEHRYLANTKEEFFLCYSALIGVFMEMNQAEIRIFGYCLRYAKGVEFDISKKLRLSMSNEININERTILNTIPSLVDKGLLYLRPDDLYQLNPRYAYQGSTVDRNNALKTIIELGCRDC